MNQLKAGIKLNQLKGKESGGGKESAEGKEIS
jgi:hypothetical protein